jgi:hypothetical protein
MSVLTRWLSVGAATKTVSAAIAKELQRATREFGIILVLAGIVSSMPCIDALGSVDIHRNQTMKDAIATNAKNDAVVLS